MNKNEITILWRLQNINLVWIVQCLFVFNCLYYHLQINYSESISLYELILLYSFIITLFTLGLDYSFYIIVSFFWLFHWCHFTTAKIKFKVHNLQWSIPNKQNWCYTGLKFPFNIFVHFYSTNWMFKPLSKHVHFKLALYSKVGLFYFHSITWKIISVSDLILIHIWTLIISREAISKQLIKIYILLRRKNTIWRSLFFWQRFSCRVSSTYLSYRALFNFGVDQVYTSTGELIMDQISYAISRDVFICYSITCLCSVYTLVLNGVHQQLETPQDWLFRKTSSCTVSAVGSLSKFD